MYNKENLQKKNNFFFIGYKKTDADSHSRYSVFTHKCDASQRTRRRNHVKERVITHAFDNGRSNQNSHSSAMNGTKMACAIYSQSLLRVLSWNGKLNRCLKHSGL